MGFHHLLFASPTFGAPAGEDDWFNHLVVGTAWVVYFALLPLLSLAVYRLRRLGWLRLPLYCAAVGVWLFLFRPILWLVLVAYLFIDLNGILGVGCVILSVVLIISLVWLIVRSACSSRQAHSILPPRRSRILFYVQAFSLLICIVAGMSEHYGYLRWVEFLMPATVILVLGSPAFPLVIFYVGRNERISAAALGLAVVLSVMMTVASYFAILPLVS